MPPSPRLVLLTALACLAAVPATARAQPGAVDPASGVVEAGLRAGFNFEFQSPLAGAHVRTSLPPASRVWLQLGGELDFLSGIVDRQAQVEAFAGLRSERTLLLGGGAALRNTVWPDGDERETRLGWSVAGIFRGDPSRERTQFEFRWTSVDAFSFLTVSLGINTALLRF